jgi:hypothetical protein
MDVHAMILCIAMELIHIPAVHVHLILEILVRHRKSVMKPQIVVIQQVRDQSRFMMLIQKLPMEIHRAG